MALTIDQATYGRSKAGNAQLFSNFIYYMNVLESAIKDDKYQAFKKTIQANWVGADADDFLRDIDKTKNDLLKKIEEIKVYFISATGDDEKQFAAFQAKNVK